MTTFGCPCCATTLCTKEDAWWRDGDTGSSVIVDTPSIGSLVICTDIAKDVEDPLEPRVYAPGPDRAADTVPGGTGSAATITVGGHVVVDIDPVGDHDWYRVDLVAGQTYVFHTSGINGSNTDAFLNLRTLGGTLITSDDDAGDGVNSLINYTATSTGTFFIDGGTWNNNTTGLYRLSVSTFAPGEVAASNATTETLAIGGATNSTIDIAGDRDWFRVDLVAGQTYLFRTGSTTEVTEATAVDTTLTLRNAVGTQLAFSDDAGEFSYSGVRFTATATGTYYLDVAGFGGATGQYNLTAFTADPLIVYSNNQIANQLTNGYWGGPSRRYNVTTGGTITYNVSAISAAGQSLAREAYALWSDVTGINFTEVFSGGQITHADNQTGAFASSSVGGGIISSSTVNVSTQWLTNYGTSLNSYSFQTYIHEIGHAIGLGHGGNYNGSASYGIDALYANDAWVTTVMSYFDQNENSYFSAQGFTRQFTVTPMVADAVATTVHYGTATTTRTGNTTYGFNNNSGRAIYDATLNPNVSYTIYDNGGTDTLDYSGFGQNQRIFLGQETFSDIGGRVGNVSIARGAVIENAIGGGGNDLITGNDVANTLNISFGGNDTVNAGAGDDIIIGGSAFNTNDTLDGGSGNDQIGFSNGGTLVLGATTLTNVEVLACLPGGGSYSITTNDATCAVGATFTVFGGNLGAGENFTVNASAETNGNIITYGGLGTDTITGGAGSDGFYFGPSKWQAGDTVVGGAGTNDQLALDGSYTLTIGAESDVETLVLLAGPSGAPNTFVITLSDIWTASGATKVVFGRQNTVGMAINGGAETGGNLIYFGGFGGDNLTSGGGNDQIYGLEGNDVITGGLGSDTAIYQGMRSAYSVVTGGGNVQIVDNDAVTDGNDGTDTVVGIEFAQFSDQSISITSPIILDLDGGGVETLSAANSSAAFDMDGDGIGDDTSWFGKGEGLLFLDRDGNGTVSNAGEFSFINDVDGARSDLEGLAAFDSNGDGQLSSADAKFREFKIWQDRNGNGAVDAREVMTLKKAGVRSLSLTGTANNATTALGDVAIVNHGTFTRTNGRNGGFIDAVLTAVASSGKDAQGATALDGGAFTSDADVANTGFDQSLSLAPSDDPFAALMRTGNADTRAIDRSLLSGSFDDAVTQLGGVAGLQRAMPAFTTADATLGAGLSVALASDYGLDRRVMLMSQDMASFGATGADVSDVDRWNRRDGRAVEMFAA